MFIEILNPLEIDDWDEQVGNLPGATFFHGGAWARTLVKSYGYKPIYFAMAEEGLTAAIPLMVVSSRLTGRRAVSLPFTDYCRPLVPHVEVSKVLFDAIRHEGRAKGWEYIELRGGADYLGDGLSSAWFYRHTLDLTPGETRLFKALRNSTRRNIKTAEKEGVAVQFEDTLEALREFYLLNCLTRREHGLPPQPWHFFKHLHTEVLSKGSGTVALAWSNGHVIAASVFLHAGNAAIYKYGASDKRLQKLRANNLLMWEAIRRFTQKGFRNLCFGRTEPENEGLRQFKAGWGAYEEIISYFRYDLSKDNFVSGTRTVSSTANRIMAKLPLPALRALGGFLYRHMG
jgi:hypothetical protein